MVRILKFIGLVLLAVGLPTILVFSVVGNHAQTKGSVELKNVTEAYIERTEQILDISLDRLRTMAQSDIHTCSAAHRPVFRDAARTGAFIHAVGLVDDNGNIMCMEPDYRDLGRTLIEPTAKNAPQIVHHVVEMKRNRGQSLATTWRIDNGKRLIVVAAPEAIRLKAGPEWLRQQYDLRITLNEDDLWYAQGRIKVGDDGRAQTVKLVSVETPSSRFPVTVQARAPITVIANQSKELEGFFAFSAIIIGVSILGLLIWNNAKSGRGLEDDIKRAIRRKEFVAFYQPVMNLETGQLAGCEALVRWRKRDGTIITPARFLPFAENSGLIYGMTRQVMRRVQADLGELYQKQKLLKVSINLVAGHFDNRRIARDAEKIFGPAAGGIDFNQVVFEVTERLPLNDMETARTTIKELQNMGFRVALDDAGTGHGGLAYIQKLGMDIIKIDKMFIDSLGQDRGSSAIVDLLVELASNMDMGVIAEGVEEPEQVDELRDMGVTFAQGFIFAPPLPANQFIALAQALSSKQTDLPKQTSDTPDDAPLDGADDADPVLTEDAA